MRRRIGSLVFAAALVSAFLVQTGAPAGAVVNNCSMTQFPAKLLSYSGLKVACTSTASGATALTIHDFSNAVWHIGSSRTITASTTSGSFNITSATGFLSAAAGPTGDIHRGVSGTMFPVGTFIKSVAGNTAVLSEKATATSAAASLMITNSQGRTVKDAHVGPGATTLTSATAGFNASDLNQLISGEGVKPGTKISVVNGPTQVTLSQAGTAPITQATVRQVSIGDDAISTNRLITDGHTTTGSATVTSATAKFTADDRGTAISGANVPAGTYILTVTNPTTIVMTKNATVTSTVARLVVGGATNSAPANGDQVSQLAGLLNLNPSFVRGVDLCSENTPEGFIIAGAWYNPGAFLAVGTAPARSIAQIVYKTSVISFAAFVTVNNIDASIATAHYDLSFGVLPVASAACAGSPSATTWTFNAVTVSQANLPGLPFVRAIADAVGPGPVAATGKVVGGSPVTTYTTNCSIGRLVSNPAFTCGAGAAGTIGFAG